MGLQSLLAHLRDTCGIGGQACQLWGGAVSICPPTIRVRCRVSEVGPVSCQRPRLGALGCDIGNSGCNVVVLCLCIGVIGQDRCDRPNGRERIASVCYWCIVVDCAFFVGVYTKMDQYTNVRVVGK